MQTLGRIEDVNISRGEDVRIVFIGSSGEASCIMSQETAKDLEFELPSHDYDSTGEEEQV